jgi:triacylglycerol lipase
MPTLTPKQAAQIAEGVYKLQTLGFTAAFNSIDGENLREGTSGRFAVTDESRVKGKSGIRTWWPITGFGFLASGIGLFEGEAIVALRGTDGAHDWMTDANASSVGGVHSGFATTWASIKPQVDQFFRGRRFKTIHCIGHSLGGALATLAALHCAESGYGAPELYTFGSPRVGFASVAQRVTAAIGASRIHRVAHSADPVPMIPLWPFVHVPTTTVAIVLDPGGLLPINPFAHRMTTRSDTKNPHQMAY